MSSRKPEFSDDSGRRAGHYGAGDRSELHREADSQSVGSLLRQLGHEVPELVMKEIALARAEIGESLRSTRNGLISMASGAAVLIPGVFVLLMAAVYGLATVMSMWLAALIVGAVVTVIGVSMVMGGKKKLEAENFKPERTMHQMHRDSEMVKQQTTKGASHERTRTH